MKSLAADIEALGFESAWIDGEIVVMNDDGVPDFNLLQNAMDASSSDDIDYFVFDLPFHGGRDLRKVPLVVAPRPARFAGRGGAGRPRAHEPELRRDAGADARGGLRDAARGDHRQAAGRALRVVAHRDLAQAQVLAAPGVRRSAASPIAPTPPAEVGALLLGTYEKGVLTYAGNVGTGWNSRAGHDLHRRLVKIEIDEPLFDAATLKPGRWSRRTAGGERWVKPELVAEVAFREWTPDGHVRHAVYQGLRIDRPARA